MSELNVGINGALCFNVIHSIEYIQQFLEKLLKERKYFVRNLKTYPVEIALGISRQISMRIYAILLR